MEKTHEAEAKEAKERAEAEVRKRAHEAKIAKEQAMHNIHILDLQARNEGALRLAEFKRV